jgi:DNA polymerase I-like protein with 3'-5' exonuclease and polymerase domains
MTGGINLNSPKQTAEFLYEALKFKEPKERTEAGARKTDKATIAALECKSERQRRFVELYHEFNRLNETFNRYLAAFKLVCDKFNGELNVSFRQCSTATHRLSGSSVKIEYEDQTYNVQPQNIQRELKPLFTAPDGWLVGEADGAQLEFRGAAQLGDDPVAFQDIRDKVDVHTNTANAFVAAKDPSFVKLSAKEARQQAKPQTFKPLYGGQGSNKYEKAYREYFVNRYKGIASTQSGWVRQVVNSPQRALHLPYGMTYYFPDAKMEHSGYVVGTTKIYNYPVQGFCTAEIIPITLISFWLRADESRVRLVSTIHDSIKAFVKHGEEEYFHHLSKVCFTVDVLRWLQTEYEYDLTVPLGCGVKIATHWAEGSEQKYDFDPATSRLTMETKEGWVECGF